MRTMQLANLITQVSLHPQPTRSNLMKDYLKGFYSKKPKFSRSPLQQFLEANPVPFDHQEPVIVRASGKVSKIPERKIKHPCS
jgi:hypothetical protein